MEKEVTFCVSLKLLLSSKNKPSKAKTLIISDLLYSNDSILLMYRVGFKNNSTDLIMELQFLWVLKYSIKELNTLFHFVISGFESGNPAFFNNISIWLPV